MLRLCQPCTNDEDGQSIIVIMIVLDNQCIIVVMTVQAIDVPSLSTPIERCSFIGRTK